jgi:CBS domain-containing protein
MKVGDVCVREVLCAQPESTVAAIAAMMKQHDVGSMPVCDQNGRLIGIVTDRDIVTGCIATGLDPAMCQVTQVMTSNPMTTQPDTDVEEAARLMGEQQIRRLPVMENGALVCMLSLGDISTALPGNPGLVGETLRKISSPSKMAA